jgi:hypothetical protein
VTIRLNREAYEFALRLVDRELFLIDGQDEHHPTPDEENDFIETNGLDAYRRWHLGIDDERPEHSKSRYTFPFGDFQQGHRCGVLAAELRASQQKYYDIEVAAAHLHGLLDGWSWAFDLREHQELAPAGATT